MTTAGLLPGSARARRAEEAVRERARMVALDAMSRVENKLDRAIEGVAKAAPAPRWDSPEAFAAEVKECEIWLAEGNIPLPHSVSLCFTQNWDDARRRVTTVTLPPLPSMSVKELVSMGILSSMRGFDRRVFLQAVEALSGPRWKRPREQ